MSNIKSQIVATIGPASSNYETLKQMLQNGLGVVRFNFSWSDFDERREQIKIIRQLEKDLGREIPILADMPGPRIQQDKYHTYDHEAISALTDKDRECIEFAVKEGVDYIGVSFVGDKQDVVDCKEFINQCGGTQKVLAKIERVKAMDNLDEIINEADAIMVARGDLGNEAPVWQVPFLQGEIIKKAKDAGKPVITATEMLLSMVSNPRPTRAEVTDVYHAIMLGSDYTMLSEETSIGKYPVEAVTIMGEVIVEAEKHIKDVKPRNNLVRISHV